MLPTDQYVACRRRRLLLFSCHDWPVLLSSFQCCSGHGASPYRTPISCTATRDEEQQKEKRKKKQDPIDPRAISAAMACAYGSFCGPDRMEGVCTWGP